MPNKKIILAIIGFALILAAAMSGCNNNRDAATAQRTPKRAYRQVKFAKDVRRQQPADEPQFAQAPISAVRPAEVLSASVRRPRATSRVASRRAVPSSRRAAPPAAYPSASPMYDLPAGVPYAATQNLARVHEPLPEPIPVNQLYSMNQNQPPRPVYQPSVYGTPQYGAYAPAQPVVYQSQPVRQQYPLPAPVVYPTPDLAMARAVLDSPMPMVAPSYPPAVMPVQYMQPIDASRFSVPIPELEPVRYQRVAVGQPADIPGWIPSPTTAMGF